MGDLTGFARRVDSRVPTRSRLVRPRSKSGPQFVVDSHGHHMSTVIFVDGPSATERSSRPWKPMTRVTWLQHRFMIFGVLGLVSCLALYMFVMGPQIHDMYARYVVN